MGGDENLAINLCWPKVEYGRSGQVYYKISKFSFSQIKPLVSNSLVGYI